MHSLLGGRGVRRLAATAALLLAPALAAQTASPSGGDPLRPGDVVRITVFRKPELSGELEVGENGTLLHPLYRELQTAGLTPAELESRLDTYLQRFEADPSFVVEPLVRVTVSGEVRQPQVYTLRPMTTVFQAVASAGGVAPTGRPTRVLLVREGITRRIDLTNPGVPGAPGAGERVRSGDVIVVDRRSTWVRDVMTPAASLVAAGAAVINLLRN